MVVLQAVYYHIFRVFALFAAFFKRRGSKKREEKNFMLDYTNLMYKMIGARLGSLRKNARIKQDSIPIENSMLSKLENGRVGKRNPYFMNQNHINTLARTFHKTPEKLLWGGEKERAGYIKLVLLALLVNGPGNVFPEGGGWNGPAPGKTKAERAAEEKAYRFFTDPGSYERYGFLAPGYDKDYEWVSNAILKNVLLDYRFSRCFAKNFIKSARESSLSPGQVETRVREYACGRGSYAGLLLEKEGEQYPRFMAAFQKFWDRAAESYLQFFEGDIFLKNEDLKRYGLKNLQNAYIHERLTSLEFLRLNERLLAEAEYTGREAAVSGIGLRLCLVGAVLREHIRKETLEGQGPYDAFAKWYGNLEACFEDSVDWLMEQPGWRR